MANPSQDGSPPTPVAPHLMPVRSFDAAFALMIDYLAQVAPMGLWAVTRVNEDTQLVLSSTGDNGAYVGTPIAGPGRELFGTVCGFDPHPVPDSMAEHQPLLDLLSAVLAGDLQVTAAVRELEQARREVDADALTGLLSRRDWDRRHEAGDSDIRAEQALENAVRQGDVLARLGGRRVRRHRRGGDPRAGARDRGPGGRGGAHLRGRSASPPTRS